MKILHITGHLGGGVGETILAWVETDTVNKHWIHSLDYINKPAKHRIDVLKDCNYSSCAIDKVGWHHLFSWADIVVLHWWDNPFLNDFISQPVPKSRMVIWAHQNYNMNPAIKQYAGWFVVTSPVMGKQYLCIKSTRDMSKFLKLSQRMEIATFNVGYVGTADYKKIHPNFISMCERVKIPNKAVFYVCGIGDLPIIHGLRHGSSDIIFMGKTGQPEDFYRIFDVFGYPLRHDHYGTSELVLGEAMAAGVVPVCMNNEAEKYIIQDGVTGYLCNNEDEYIENIEHLYHKPLLRRWMGDNARQAATEMYDINKMVRDWNNVFYMMMDGENKQERGIVKVGGMQ
jgi:glycosyltransferase involved in cell wall biosynthesis